MNILAVDTAGKTAAVAVLRDDTLLYEAQCNNGLTHSETLLPMIDTALKASGLTMDELDVLGVTNGPGSFTGLRIGLAVIKGLALQDMAMRMLTKPLGLAAVFSYAQALAKPAKPPRYMMPGTPRLRLPDFRSRSRRAHRT